MTRRDIYAALLNAEGLVATPGSDGTVLFKYEGDKYVLLTYADDQDYIGISTTYRLPEGVRQSVALREANALTGRSKVAKVYLRPGRSVTIAAELFLKEPEHLDDLLPRLIHLVQTTAASLFTRFEERARSSAPALSAQVMLQ